MDKPIVIVGGGIVGLSSAWYLRHAGYEVCVVDRGDLLDNCSYGNAGYVSPSHFIPLAAPGVLGIGLRSMFDSKSPLYIAPQLNMDLLRWGWQFMRSSNHAHVQRSAPVLRDILMLSRGEYAQWANIPGFDFAFNPSGLLELFKTEKSISHAARTVAMAAELGLGAKVLAPDACQNLEPHVRMEVAGGIFFDDDVQTYPPKLMGQLLKRLPELGVEIRPNCEVTGFDTDKGRVQTILTSQGAIACREVVIAAGTWSASLCKSLGLKFTLMPGRGYSITYSPPPIRFKHPVILEDARVAISPMDGDKLRFGGTMEITKVGSRLRIERMRMILKGVERFFPDIQLPNPLPGHIWHGYRPLSRDGLPYIGRSNKWANVVVATGHSMLGLAMGAGTGKLVKEIIKCEKTSIGIGMFSVER